MRQGKRRRTFDNATRVTSVGGRGLRRLCYDRKSLMHFDEDEVPLISGTGEAFMDVPGTPATGTRRDEDIALDLMKFIAMTTGYGKTTSGGGGVGFEKTSGAAAKPEEYSAHLLELYAKRLSLVSKK